MNNALHSICFFVLVKYLNKISDLRSSHRQFKCEFYSYRHHISFRVSWFHWSQISNVDFRFGYHFCVVNSIHWYAIGSVRNLYVMVFMQRMKNGDSVNMYLWRQWKLIGMRGWWMYRWFHPITFTFYHQNSCKKRHLRVHILKAFSQWRCKRFILFTFAIWTPQRHIIPDIEQT